MDSKKGDTKIIESLIRFGLSAQEARLYFRLPSVKTLSDEGISEELKMPIKDVNRIMKSLEQKGFVKSRFEGIYEPSTPVEALSKRVEAILSELYKLKGDIVDVLEERFTIPELFACGLDRSHFNILVNRLTRDARYSLRILTRELRFIDDAEFLSALEKNPRLRAESVKILLTASKGTPGWGNIISNLRDLSKSPKVWIRHNPSRTELRYMIVDKKQVLLVESTHRNAAIISSSEVADYFDRNFDHYFGDGRNINDILEAVEDIKDPEQKDEEVKEKLVLKGII